MTNSTKIAQGTTKISATGKIVIQLTKSTVSIFLVLNVFFAPDMYKNFISVTCSSNQNLNVFFNKYEARITVVNNQNILVVPLINKIYSVIANRKKNID